jgi:hypothetical protein
MAPFLRAKSIGLDPQKKGEKKELKGQEFMIWRTKMQATHLGCSFSFWGQQLEVNLIWAKGVTL